MYALNLDPEFVPFPEMKAIPVQRIDFPSGCEPHIRVHLKDLSSRADEFLITTRIRNMNDLLCVMLASDALRGRLGSYWDTSERQSLFMPFMPHARQDRRAVDGDAFSVQIVGSLINTARFTGVHVFDPHSAATGLSVTNCVEHRPKGFIADVVAQESRKTSELAIILPDAGARKRLFVTVDALSFLPLGAARWKKPTVLCFEKKRDATDGNLSFIAPVMPANLQEHTCIIIDDICDGGRTFLPLATALKSYGAQRVVLAVSHGIFSKGLDVLFNNGIDHVHTTNSFQDLDHDGANIKLVTQHTDWSRLLDRVNCSWLP